MEAGNPRLRCQQIWLLLRTLLGLLMSIFLLCSHVAFSLYTHVPGVSFSSYKDTILIGLGLHPMPSFKALSSNESHWELELQHTNFEGKYSSFYNTLPLPTKGMSFLHLSSSISYTLLLPLVQKLILPSF